MNYKHRSIGDIFRRFLTILTLVSLSVLLLSWFVQAINTRPAVPVVQSSKLRVSERRCAECHAEITTSFASAPHSRTLSRISDPEVARCFENRSFHNESTGVKFRYEMRDGRLIVSTSAYARELYIDWVFGSGTHAMTPLITWADDPGETCGIEHGVSWYPGDQLGVTLGMDKLHEPEGILALGNPRPSAEVINCFGCHSSYIPVAGRAIDLENIEPGVGCVRCHADAARHLSEMDQGVSAQPERLSLLTPIESVNRCGECHRRADEMSGDILPEDQSLARFASVGLVQSACFKQQDKVANASGEPVRFDCNSCHNPHQGTTSDWRVHASVCLSCHQNGDPQMVMCHSAARDENCLSCHMPQQPANENLHFTDHWIRIR